MEMNSVMATEIVAAEVEHIVLPQIVSIKQASRMLGLPPYYLRRLCKEVPGVAFQSGIKWYINLGKLVDYYNKFQKFSAFPFVMRSALNAKKSLWLPRQFGNMCCLPTKCCTLQTSGIILYRLSSRSRKKEPALGL